MDERIKVGSEQEDNFNIGAMAGATLTPPLDSDFYVKLNWDNHLFLAGEGGILLANGRKQSINVVVGSYF